MPSSPCFAIRRATSRCTQGCARARAAVGEMLPGKASTESRNCACSAVSWKSMKRDGSRGGTGPFRRMAASRKARAPVSSSGCARRARPSRPSVARARLRAALPQWPRTRAPTRSTIHFPARERDAREPAAANARAPREGNAHPECHQVAAHVVDRRNRQEARLRPLGHAAAPPGRCCRIRAARATDPYRPTH